MFEIAFPDSTMAKYEPVVMPSVPQLYHVKHWPIGDPYRDGRPEVVRMLPDHKTPMTKEWQEFDFALTRLFWPEYDYSTAVNKWTAKWGCHLWGANNTGFECSANPPHEPRANFIKHRDEGAALLMQDKTRSFGGAVVAGVEDGDVLRVETLDGNSSPPSVEYVLERPWLYFHCVIAFKERVGLFGAGCIKDLGIYQPTVSSLVSMRPVYLELSKLEKLPPGSPVPDPYVLGI